VQNAFYFADGGSFWPSKPLRIGMSARSILQTVSMVEMTMRICILERDSRVEVVRVIETVSPPSAPRLPYLA